MTHMLNSLGVAAQKLHLNQLYFYSMYLNKGKKIYFMTQVTRLKVKPNIFSHMMMMTADLKSARGGLISVKSCNIECGQLSTDSTQNLTGFFCDKRN